jgi:hypothetical protein
MMPVNPSEGLIRTVLPSPPFERADNASIDTCEQLRQVTKEAEHMRGRTSYKNRLRGRKKKKLLIIRVMQLQTSPTLYNTVQSSIRKRRGNKDYYNKF